MTLPKDKREGKKIKSAVKSASQGSAVCSITHLFNISSDVDTVGSPTLSLEDPTESLRGSNMTEVPHMTPWRVISLNLPRPMIRSWERCPVEINNGSITASETVCIETEGEYKYKHTRGVHPSVSKRASTIWFFLQSLWITKKKWICNLKLVLWGELWCVRRQRFFD